MRNAVGRVPGINRELVFAVHDHGDKHVSERIATDGIWEPFETEVIRRFVTSRRAASPQAGSPQAGTEGAAFSQDRTLRRPLFVDCGANLGWYSVVAGVFGADVIAAEPMPANAALLHVNLQANAPGMLADGATIEIIDAALGEASGTTELTLSATNQGDHRLVPRDNPDTVGRKESRRTRERITVEVRTLDGVLKGRRPDLIKIDTQGSEVAILRGGRRGWAPSINEGAPIIVLEFWPYGLQTCGYHFEDLLAILGELIDVTHHGFEIVEWQQQLRPVTVDVLRDMATNGGFSPTMKGFTNLVLVPHDEVDVVRDLIAST
jgi:FkbM family methyltransferase